LNPRFGGSTPSRSAMKNIPGIKDYSITKEGKIFSNKKKEFLRPYNNGNGYMAIKLFVNGKRQQKYIHRLVTISFIDENNKGEVNHIDGNKTNNSVENLEIVSHKDNMVHAFKNGLLKGFVSKYY
jgi:HNH endonuclease